MALKLPLRSCILQATENWSQRRPGREANHTHSSRLPYVPVQVEPKHGLIDKTLLHHVMEHGVDVVDSDGREGHSQDPIKPGIDECGAWLLHSLTECLVLHRKTSNLVATWSTEKENKGVKNEEHAHVQPCCHSDCML